MIIIAPKFKVVSYESSSMYDPDFCHNGGGYEQPRVVLKGGSVSVTIIDESCGDFGDRYHVMIDVAGIVFHINIDEIGCESDFSELPDSFWPLAEEIQLATGGRWYIPTKSEL